MSERIFDVVADGRSIPATFVQPDTAAPTGAAALLLHGTASHRDEVGEMYRRLARALAEVGVATLRIDFPGCGASSRPQTDFTVESELADAGVAYEWLAAHEAVDPRRIFVVGFSQGGMIAALLSGGGELSVPPAGLVTWSSGDVSIADRDASFAARFAGDAPEAVFDMGFVRFTFSRRWWEQFRAADIAAAARRHAGPLLAIAGSDDDVVTPAASRRLLDAAGGVDLTLIQVPGADHIFNVLADDGSDASERVLRATTAWIEQRAIPTRVEAFEGVTG